jgi:hypothetical protein
MVEVETALSTIAILMSFWSVYYTKKFWFESNRPILSASIELQSSGLGIALWNLVIYNSGNRPATNITLEAKKEDIDSIISVGAKDSHRTEIHRIFSTNSHIGLLLNSENVKTAFFSFSNNTGSAEDIIKYEGKLPIKIHYSDINKRRYVSNIILYMRDGNGFGGSVWN